MNDILLPTSQRLDLIKELLTRDVGEFAWDIERNGNTALYLITTDPQFDINAPLASYSDTHTPLFWAMFSLGKFTQRKGAFSPNLSVSPDPAAHWPNGVADLPAFERLAMYLIRKGADPWKEEDGTNIMDLAVAYGAHNLVDMLLRHPNCPPIEELSKRTHNLPGRKGRKLPYLHLAAYVGNMTVFEQLVNQGMDVMIRDRQGLPAVAWCNSPDIQSTLLDFYTQEQINGFTTEVQKFYGYRESKNIKDNVFQLHQLNTGLQARSKQSEEDKRQTELFVEMDKMLSANPRKFDFSLRVYIHQAGSGNFEWLVARSIENLDLRRVVKLGDAKGSWSYPASVIWALTRSDVSLGAISSVAHFSKLFLERLPTDKRKEFLDEEIRPGMTNRGMIALLCGSELGSCLEYLTEGLPNGVEGALDQMVGFIDKTVSRRGTWSGQVTSRWTAILEKSGILNAPVESSLRFIYKSCQALVEVRPSLSASQYNGLVQRAISFLSQKDLTEEKLDWINNMLMFGYINISEPDHRPYLYADRVPVQYYESRKELYAKMLLAIEENPQVAKKLSLNYPFTCLSDREKKYLPNPEEWQSQINRARLTALASVNVSPTDLPARVKKPSI